MFGSAIKETTTSTGTGNLTLAGAASGFRTINSEFSNDTTDAGIYFNYHVFDASRTEWEAGIGHLSASGTLVRDLVERSSNADALVNFSAGTKIVVASPIGAGIVPCLPAVPTTGPTKRIALPDWYSTLSTASFSADSLQMIPFLHRTLAKVDAVAFEVTTAGSAGADGISGIYAMKHNGDVGRLIVTGAEVAVDSTGIKLSTFTARRLPPGWYWLATVLNATATLRSISAAIASVLGVDTALNANYRRSSTTHVYNSALPAAPSTNVNSGGHGVLMGLRMA